jgi:hypothetical protein
MTQGQTLLEIAILAAGAVGRDLAPPNTSAVKTAVQKITNVVKVRRAPPAAPTGFFTMYDAVTVANIPADAHAIAGYTDGLYRNVQEIRRRFGGRMVFTISVSSTGFGDCLDVENGDATPAQAAVWVRERLRAGQWRPCIYASRSNMPAVWAELQHAGVQRDQVRLWVADWTGEPHIPAGYDACQYHGGTTVPYDISLCNPGFLR